MWRLVIGLPIVVVFLLLFVMTPALANCGDHGDLAAEAVLQCPRALELIGKDAHAARIGWACGTTEMEGNYGRASWSVPFTGKRGRGTVSYDASEHAGTWTLDRAMLEIDGETIDLVACRRPQSTPRPATAILAQTNADAVTATFDGKVLRSTHPTIGEKAACRGELQRDRGSASARVKVSCTVNSDAPGLTLYEGTGSFSLDVRDSTKRDDDRSEYDDSKTSDADGTPGCRLSSSGGSATLTIWNTSPAYEIVVAL